MDRPAAKVDCPTCHGASTVDPDPDCPTCHGEGEVDSAGNGAPGDPVTASSADLGANSGATPKAPETPSRTAAQGHSEQPPGPGWPPVMTDEEAKAKLREKVAARRERDAAPTASRCDTSTASARRGAVEVIETSEHQEYEVVKSGVGWPEPKVIWRGPDRFYAARLAETAQRAYTHLTVWVRDVED